MILNIGILNMNWLHPLDARYNKEFMINNAGAILLKTKIQAIEHVLVPFNIWETVTYKWEC